MREKLWARSNLVDGVFWVALLISAPLATFFSCSIMCWWHAWGEQGGFATIDCSWLKLTRKTAMSPCLSYRTRERTNNTWCKKFSELLMLQCSDCSILIVWIFQRCFDREVLLRTKFGSCYLCGFHFQREKESSAWIRFLQPADCGDKKLEVLWKTKQSLFCTQLQLVMIPDQNMHQRVGHWLSLGKTINRLRLHLRPFPCSIFFCN